MQSRASFLTASLYSVKLILCCSPISFSLIFLKEDPGFSRSSTQRTNSVIPSQRLFRSPSPQVPTLEGSSAFPVPCGYDAQPGRGRVEEAVVRALLYPCDSRPASGPRPHRPGWRALPRTPHPRPPVPPPSSHFLRPWSHISGQEGKERHPSFIQHLVFPRFSHVTVTATLCVKWEQMFLLLLYWWGNEIRASRVTDLPSLAASQWPDWKLSLQILSHIFMLTERATKLITVGCSEMYIIPFFLKHLIQSLKAFWEY